MRAEIEYQWIDTSYTLVEDHPGEYDVNCDVEIRTDEYGNITIMHNLSNARKKIDDGKPN